MTLNEEKRKQRINLIYNSVNKCGADGCDKEKLIAMMGIEQGITRRTSLEYIKMLIFCEKIELKGKILIFNSLVFGYISLISHRP